jgi:hypothetical protein
VTSQPTVAPAGVDPAGQPPRRSGSASPAHGPAPARASELKPKSFSELRALPAEPDWLWQGFLAPGSLTMLAGHPFAGKSMLVSGLFRALETGEPFLGRTTKAASALLVTEEDQASLRERAGRFELFEIRSEYLDRSSSVGHDWAALIAGATELALAEEHRLLVIDTFPGLAGLGDEQENDAGAITSRLQPLQVAAGAGLAVLFLHHMNNANQPRGSRPSVGWSTPRSASYERRRAIASGWRARPDRPRACREASGPNSFNRPMAGSTARSIKARVETAYPLDRLTISCGRCSSRRVSKALPTPSSTAARA